MVIFNLGLVGNQAFSKFPHSLLGEKLWSHNSGTLESTFVRGKALESGKFLKSKLALQGGSEACVGDRDVGPKTGAVFEVCISASHLGVLWPSRTGEQGLGIGS